MFAMLHASDTDAIRPEKTKCFLNGYSKFSKGLGEFVSVCFVTQQSLTNGT